MIYYKQVYETFRQNASTVFPNTRNFTDWHKGRNKYYFWGLGVECPEVISRWQQAKQHLAPFLLKNNLREAHITLFVFGFLIAEDVDEFDYFTHQDFEQAKHLIKQANPASFSILIGALNSFISAPFLEVIDQENRLQELRNIFCRIKTENRQVTYVPHLTVGLFANAFSTAEISETLQTFKAENYLELKVNEIGFYSYDTTDIGSCIQLEYSHMLTEPVVS